MERLFWEVVSSNQSEFPDEHRVSVVGPDGDLEDKEAIRGVLRVHEFITDLVRRTFQGHTAESRLRNEGDAAASLSAIIYRVFLLVCAPQPHIPLVESLGGKTADLKSEDAVTQLVREAGGPGGRGASLIGPISSTAGPAFSRMHKFAERGPSAALLGS